MCDPPLAQMSLGLSWRSTIQKGAGHKGTNALQERAGHQGADTLPKLSGHIYTSIPTCIRNADTHFIPTEILVHVNEVRVLLDVGQRFRDCCKVSRVAAMLLGRLCQIHSHH